MIYTCSTRYDNTNVSCGVAHNSESSCLAHVRQLEHWRMIDGQETAGCLPVRNWRASGPYGSREEAHQGFLRLDNLGQAAYKVSKGLTSLSSIAGANEVAGHFGLTPKEPQPETPGTPAWTPKAEPKAEHPPAWEEPKAEPAPAAPKTEDIGAALGALQSLLVDQSVLRGMVREAVDQRVPRRIEVKVGDTPAKPVEGRAHQALERVLKLAGLRQNVLLVGPAGSGKTTLASQVAEAMGLGLWTISLSGGTTESHFKGRYVPTGEGGRFEYVPSPFVGMYENGGVILLDELDAADENVLVGLNTALDNGYMDLPDRVGSPVARRHPDTVILASANTYGSGANRQYCGRNALDAATLDRFVAGLVEMDYDRSLEEALVETKALRERLWKLRDAVAQGGLRRLVSTRVMVALDKQLSQGILPDVNAALSQLVSGWSEDELRTAGVSL